MSIYQVRIIFAVDIISNRKNLENIVLGEKVWDSSIGFVKKTMDIQKHPEILRISLSNNLHLSLSTTNATRAVNSYTLLQEEFVDTHGGPKLLQKHQIKLTDEELQRLYKSQELVQKFVRFQNGRNDTTGKKIIKVAKDQPSRATSVRANSTN